ncbi:MAG: iron-containing alcohol dehydrogenase [Dictyoglomus sp.]
MFHLLEIPKKVIYGRGSVLFLGGELKKIGNKFLILTGETSLKRSGALDRIMNEINKHDLEIIVITGIPAEPSLEVAKQICDRIVGNNFDGVVGIGGGSVMDMAKIIAFTLKTKLNPLEAKGKEIEEALPIITVPTTAGTGSEATKFAVITDESSKDKFIIMGKALIPTLTIIDPELTFTMSPLIASSTGIDAFCHAIESYLSRNSTCMIECYSKSAIYDIYNLLPEAVLNQSEKAKERMAYAAFWAGVAINNTKTTLIHAMSRPLGGMYKIPHGIANGILLPAYLRFNAPFIPPEKYKFLKDLFQGEPAEKVEEFLKTLNLPTRISQIIQEELDLDLLVRKAWEAEFNIKNNIRPVTEEDIYNLFLEVM